jgi:hypothetical protein
MSVIPKLATSLGRRDEVPNQELAQEIISKKDKKAVQELVDNLRHKDKGIQSDCVKTLYEIGERNPALITGHASAFIALLSSKNNRLQWGAMAALSAIATADPKSVYPALAQIIAVADSGSVISRDHAVKTLVALGGVREYSEDVFALYIEQLMAAPTNQLPSYAEQGMVLTNDKNKALFIKTLTSRRDDIESETKKKRVEKVIKKIG